MRNHRRPPDALGMNSAIHSGDPGGTRYFTALLRGVRHAQKPSEVIAQFSQRMRSLLDVLPMAVWITQGESMVYANKACARLFGVAHRESLTGQSIYGLLNPGVHDLLRTKMAHALASQNEVLGLHAKIDQRDGTAREVEMVVAALPGHPRTLVQMVISDVTKHAQARPDLLRSRCTLRDLAASVVDAREEERRRIARELHDELGQRLMALKLELSALAVMGAPDIPSARIQSMVEMVDDTVAATRRISTDLRPLMLDDLGLSAAIEWLAQDFERRAGLQVELRLDALPDLMPQKVLTALYRIVQEALTNIVRHAHASRVVMVISRSAASIQLRVQDNGDGFPDRLPQPSKKSLGLIGIRERVLMLGGRMDIGNLPDGGARLVVTLPLHGTDGTAGGRQDALLPGDTP